MSRKHACCGGWWCGLYVKKHLVLFFATTFPFILFLTLITSPIVIADGWHPNTGASNQFSISNTRHNLTQSYLADRAGIMNIARNDYGEVCVCCHTPHGGNRQIDAPLWNRTINQSSYTLYDKPRTLNQPISQPGPNSLTCLSCHDGTIAIDSIINMPGSGSYNPAQETSVNEAFLSTWIGPGIGNHWVLGTGTAGGACTFCHNANEDFGAPDYTVFTIGTDLNNDHPIGIVYPTTMGPGIDFHEPTLNFINNSGTGEMTLFDNNGNGYPDKDEPRMYDTGDGPEVECASCHDPHGVPSAGPGSEFIASFLRVSNGDVNTGIGDASGLCLTCHVK